MPKPIAVKMVKDPGFASFYECSCGAVLIFGHDNRPHEYDCPVCRAVFPPPMPTETKWMPGFEQYITNQRRPL